MADMIRADLRASYAISENSSSVGTAHWANYNGLASPGNATRI